MLKMLKYISFLIIVSSIDCTAQLLDLNSMHVTFGANHRKSADDLTASLNITQEGQTINLKLKVKDDDVITSPKAKFRDKIEIYFATSTTDFIDYVYGINAGNPRIFRQNNEPSSLVDLNAFVVHGDYPKTSISKSYPIPPSKSLVKKKIPIGMVGFEISLGADSKATMLLRNDYAPFEKKVNQKLGDLSAYIKSKYSQNDGGYVLELIIDKLALGFFSIPTTSNFKMLVDVFDCDREHPENYTVLSSHQSREYQRPFYFNEIKLETPFVYNFENIQEAALQLTNITINGMTGAKGVYSYGQLLQTIIYDRNVFSEADMLEFQYYPENYAYAKHNLGAISYELISYKSQAKRPFAENELMFVYENTVQSSKNFAYDRNKTSNFVNQMALLPNGFPGLGIYDFEPEEYNGWSSCGICSDEIVALYSLRDPKKVEQIFILGAKLKRNQEVYIDKDKYEQVKDFEINWIENGKSFVVKIIFLPSSKKGDLEIMYDIDEQLIVKKRQ